MYRISFYPLSVFLLAIYTASVPSVYAYDYEYAGCYAELSINSNGRALKGDSFKLQKMTLDKCLSHCKYGHTSYAYAGLQFGRECYCSDGLNETSVPIANETCDYPCAGDGTEFCGGNMAISLYKSPTAAGQRFSIPVLNSLLAVGMVIGIFFSCC